MNFKKSPIKRFSIFLTPLYLIASVAIANLVFLVSNPEARPSALATTPAGSFSELVKEVKPAVVYISTVKVIKGRRGFVHPFGPNDPFGDFFDHFFGQNQPHDYKQKGLGSGFIIDKKGLILTNNHVVEKSDEITVTLADKKSYPAKIIGKDPKTDLALIKIDADDDLTPLHLGDSDILEVGDWVVAIGNPYGLGNTVTAGIVSYKSRNIGAGPYDDFIQTDAAINPGNSGGPLLNTKGEVIGISTAIFSQSGGNIGIGFAIPINMAKNLLPQLMEGKVIRGWLGVMIQKITPELKEALKLKDEKGALVSDVSPDGPAKAAGIRRGDVIISFDGKTINEMRDLPMIVASTPVGKKVKVKVIREGDEETFKVQVGELPGQESTEKTDEPETNLGMVVNDLTPQMARELGISETNGVVVVQVQQGSPAGEAGLRPGDLIMKIGNQGVQDLSDYYEKIHEAKPGDILLFLVKREDTTLYITLKIED